MAAVFAIHPLRAESVAWVSERKDVLSGLFFMLTLGAYVRYVHKPRSLARYLAVLLLFTLGLLCKPMLVTLPFVLLVLDWWPLRRFTPPALGTAQAQPLRQRNRFSVALRLVMEKLPFVALSAAAGMATLLAQVEGIQPSEAYPPLLRLSNALVSCVAYLGQMLYPAGLAAHYPFPKVGLPVWKVVLAAALITTITAGAIILRRRHPYMLAGWLWYLGMLLPVVGVIQVGSQAHADRYTYLPQIGIYLFATWMVSDWCAGWRHRRLGFGGIASGLIAALMVCAWIQTSYWKSSETLWTHALACTSGNSTAHNNLGGALFEKGRVDEAISHYRSALRIKPTYAEAYHRLAMLFSRLEKWTVRSQITKAH